MSGMFIYSAQYVLRTLENPNKHFYGGKGNSHLQEETASCRQTAATTGQGGGREQKSWAKRYAPVASDQVGCEKMGLGDKCSVCHS